MAILAVLLYPDERLRQMSESVDDFADPAFQERVDDLIATVHAHPGCVGIAAPQVGWSQQVVVIDCGRARKPLGEHHGLLVLCNPLILKWSGLDVAREGCLSLPEYTGNVVRATDLTVQYKDRHGGEQTLVLNGFEARVVQHEVDHLEGRLFIDRVVSRKSDLFRRKVFATAPSA